MAIRTESSVFGVLLRRHRLAAGLSQEELAERARISRRSLSDMERGVPHRPRRETVHLLAEALGLSAAERLALMEAALRLRAEALGNGSAGSRLIGDGRMASAQVGLADELSLLELPFEFGVLLRRYRVASELTQEELAEQAQMSVRTVSDLERGVIQHPQRLTAEQLAAALHLADDDLAQFTRAACGSVPDRGPQGAPLEPYLMSLPREPTSFIGREQELALVARKLRDPQLQLLTLTGPGGIGKTRLAMQAARITADRFPHGVVFVPLAAARMRDLVMPTIAGTLQLNARPGPPAFELVARYLRPRELLLILDNVEHLLPAAPAIGELLAACPRLTIMVTSRAVLRLAAEQVVEVPPLASPDPAQLPPLEDVGRYDAVALFVERASARQADFVLTPANVAAVVGICRRLDGLPLAIELAAARIPFFPPQALLVRLSRRLPLLTSGVRDAPERHQTLRGTIDWSYDLLTPAEQTLLARLSVFQGGCTLEAAAAVCGENAQPESRVMEGGDTYPESRVLEEMASLVDKSLVRQAAGSDDEPRVAPDHPAVPPWRMGQAARSGDEPRFSMLETVREYAQEKLEERGETEAIRRRHTRYLTELTERAAAEMSLARIGRPPSTDTALHLVQDEYHNLEAALTWLVEIDETTLGLRLAGALRWPWYHYCDTIAPLQRILEDLLPRRAEVPAPVVAEALLAVEVVAGVLGSRFPSSVLGEGIRPGDEALAIYRRLGDRQGLLAALLDVGWADVSIWHGSGWGSAAHAQAGYEEALVLAREFGATSAVGAALRGLGTVASQVNHDLGKARELYEESLAVERATGNLMGIALSLHKLVHLALLERDGARAMELADEADHIYADLGLVTQIGMLCGLRAQAALLEHRPAVVHGLFCEVLSEAGNAAWEEDVRAYVAHWLKLLATSRGLQGRVSGPRLFAAASAVLQFDTGWTVPGLFEECLAVGRSQIGERAWEAAWEEGRAMTLQEALTNALAEPALD